MKSYYLLEIKQDVEPEIHGPYGDEAYRDDMALILRANDPEMENGLFPMDLDVEPTGMLPKANDHRLEITSYSAAFFMEKTS